MFFFLNKTYFKKVLSTRTFSFLSPFVGAAPPTKACLLKTVIKKLIYAK